MNEFKSYHPAVNFLYFAAVLLFSMFLLNPVTLLISLVCFVSYSVMLNGKRAVRFSLLCLLPTALFAVLLNLLLNHEGATILTYLPSGNPLTLESALYGLAAAVMIVSVICCFSCFNRIMTSDKIIYLFGRVIPSLSLIFSMSLRFVPRFKEQLLKTASAQKCIGRGMNGGIIRRVKSAVTILSVMLTHSLEGSIETADSMRARGYGLSGRSTFSIYTLSGRDRTAILYTALLTVYVIAGIVFGAVDFLYFPQLTHIAVNVYSVSVFLAYFLLCAQPIIIEITENVRWKHLKSKI